MNAYAGAARRSNRAEEQIFGRREFAFRGMERKVVAELVGYGNQYFARINDALHRATLTQYEGGKTWVADPNPVARR